MQKFKPWGTNLQSANKMEYCKFLENYRQYTSGNETPELIHLWVGLSTLAGACEKRIWIEQGYFKTFLNLYTIIIAPAGVCAKSTSMDLGLKMLKEIGFNVLEGAILKEKIIVEMLESEKAYVLPDGTAFPHSSTTFVANELNVLLSTGMDMVKFLVDIYDKDDIYTYKTKNAGEYEVSNPYFNLIGAAVPQWFGSSVAQDMGATGFLARCIIVYQDKKRKKVPRIIITDKQKSQRSVCVDILTSIIDNFGPMAIAEEAWDYYAEWYLEQEISPTEDYRIASYLERRTKIHVIKVAALMALGDMRNVVEVIDFKRAIHLFIETEYYMRTAYIIAGGNPLAIYINQTIKMLEINKGPIKISDLVTAYYTDLTSDDFKSMIETMQAMGCVRVRIAGSESYLELINARYI
jgi:hypothetical protein